MAKLSRLSAIAVVGLCVSPLVGARVARAGDEAKMSIKIQTEEGAKIELETSAGWLQGLIDSADVECEADEDRDTRRMMASLERQGEGGIYRGVDGDGDFVARRRGGMLRRNTKATPSSARTSPAAAATVIEVHAGRNPSSSIWRRPRR